MKSVFDIEPTADIDIRALIGSNVTIGARCIISSGAVLCSGLVLGSDVIVGPNAVFVDSMSLSNGPATNVQHGVCIGANATIYPGITLAAGCVVRPGAVVSRPVPPRAIVEGNPATIIGYVGTEPRVSSAKQIEKQPGCGERATEVRGVTIHTFPIIPDLRGNLTVGEFSKEIPFTPLRYFMVFGVPTREVRGEHAHRECHQFLICVRGSCSVVADDGHARVEAVLDAPNRGVYLPPLTWGTQYKYSPEALLLVFASHRYDAADYIRDYDDFLRQVGGAK